MTRTTSLLVFLFALALSKVHGETLKLGVRTSDDRPLQRLHLTTQDPGPGYRLGAIDKMQVLPGENGAIISQLVIEDRSTTRCATATPINGGPGSSFVVLRIVAPDECVIDYMIELYGK